ncbi:MAG TPA: FAD-dependent oxidoreductase [Rhizomicrobium sp.]|nr:FAD-dependent oxidoreductase [Rhizomicrobium sp.]
MEHKDFDVVVIGAGMAGASAAAEIARTCRVVLLERESQPGYHSTGRSAALFSETYGNAVVRALTRASRNFFYTPPDGFAEHSLVRTRGSLHIARNDQIAALKAFFALPDVAANARLVDAKEARRLCPLLRDGYAAAAILEPDAADVDVHALHQGYLRQFRTRGGVLITDAGVTALQRTPANWFVRTTAGEFGAPIVVNAAGAWADGVAAIAGLGPLGITPNRRTALLVDPPPGIEVDSLPNTIDVEEQFYFKPDAGKLFLSPADETPSLPCDAQPDEIDVAVAIDRVQRAADIDVRHVRRKWAGLRSFAPDRSPVIGYDERAKGFFWLAGQGGYGIQTAPAAGLLASALVSEGRVPELLAALGVEEAPLSPSRFMGRPYREAAAR